MNNDGLTNDEINRKSTSHKIKKRIAHIPKFPHPVVKKPITPIQQEKCKQKNFQMIKPNEKVIEKVKPKVNQVCIKRSTTFNI